MSGRLQKLPKYAVPEQIVIYTKRHSVCGSQHRALLGSENLRGAADLKHGLEPNSLVADRLLSSLGTDTSGGNRANTGIVEWQSLVQHINVCSRSHDNGKAVGYSSLCCLVLSILKQLNQKPTVVVSADVFREVGHLFIVGFTRSDLLKDRFEPLTPQFFEVHGLPPLR